MLAYISLVLALRWAGNRTLAKMNAFDLVVTVSLGSILATIAVSKDVVLSEGIVAFATLIALQFLVTWSSVRFRWVRQLVTGEPQLLFERGVFLTTAMNHARITEGEIRAAVRSAGLIELAEVEAVVLETDGSLSVVHEQSTLGSSSLSDVRRRD